MCPMVLRDEISRLTLDGVDIVEAAAVSSFVGNVAPVRKDLERFVTPSARAFQTTPEDVGI